MWGVLRISGMDVKILKSRNLASGVRFPESARSIFSLWVQNERVMEKGWHFDKKMFLMEEIWFSTSKSRLSITAALGEGCRLAWGPKYEFLNHDKKKSEFDLGSAFFGISEVDFLPMGTEWRSYVKRMEFWQKMFLIEKIRFLTPKIRFGAWKNPEWKHRFGRNRENYCI